MSLCMVLVLVLPALAATEPVSEGATEDLAESSWNSFLYCKCGLSCQVEDVGSWHVFTLGSACGCLECPEQNGTNSPLPRTGKVVARQPAEVPKQPLDGDAAVAQAIGAEVSAPTTKLRATWDSAHMKSANLLFCRCGKHCAKGRILGLWNYWCYRYECKPC
ncbi:ppsA [Symbiodinium sp. CCMP2592]|nr:ppsA [Symbiodinium sp. CCMP2592]